MNQPEPADLRRCDLVRATALALRAGCPDAFLVEHTEAMNWDRLAAHMTLGISAGASAPEQLVVEFIDACRARFTVTIEEISVRQEDVSFNLPRMLVA